MTEQEILRLQEVNGQRSFYLVLVGKFLHACGCGAFALSRATGYRVRRKQRRWGEVVVCGFPIDRFDLVRDRIRAAGGDIFSQDSKTWMFRGLDGTPDPQMVCEPAPKPEPKPQTQYATTEILPAAGGYGWLAERGLRLHPRKVYLQHYSKGVMFVGGMIKPGRKYLSHRTRGRLYAKVYHYNQLLAAADPTREQLEGMVATMNSYLGMMCHYNELCLFRHVLMHVSPQWYRHVWFSRRGRRVKAVVRMGDSVYAGKRNSLRA